MMRARETGVRTLGAGGPHVVGLCGSRREGSYTRRALQVAMSGVEATGGTAELMDLAELDLPPLDPDEDPSEAGEVVRRTIRDAHAVILGTPMYHGSCSGVLKNALDHCGFDEFEQTSVGLLVVSGGPFPTLALSHLRDICRSLNAWVLPHQAAIPRADTVFDGDDLTDRDLRGRVQQLGEQVVEFAAIEPRRIEPAQCLEVPSGR